MNSPRPAGERWFYGALLLGAAGLTLVLQIMFRSFTCEDSYFTFRYAANLLAGHGLTYNPPEHVEGFSNPLWLLLLALGRAISGADLVALSHVYGLLFLAGTVAAILHFVRRTLPEETRWRVLALTLGWMALTPGLQVYTQSGLEVPLLTFLLTLGTLSSLSILRHPKRLPWLAAVCFGLAGITRPEGPLYSALWGLAWVVAARRRDDRPARLRLAAVGAVAALPALLYETFRIFYFGLAVPLAAIAKTHDVFAGMHAEYTPWLAPLMLAFLLLLLARRDRANARQSGAYWRIAVGPVFAGLIFLLYAGSDWMLFSRFLVPVLPLTFLGISLSAHPILTRLRSGIALAVVGANSAMLLLPYLRNDSLESMLMRGNDQVKVGQWLATTFPEKLRIVGRRTGAVGYYAPQHDVRDQFGLTDTAQAYFLRRHGWAAALALKEQTPVLARPPDLLMVTRPPAHALLPRYAPEERAYLSRNGYRCIKSFPQGSWGTYDMWLRGGLHPELPPVDCAERGRVSRSGLARGAGRGE